MQKIVPNIWCNGNAEEVGDFYASVFPTAQVAVESRYPEEGLLDFQQPLAGQPLTVGLNIAGTRIVLINAGDEFAPNPSVSFMLNFDPLLFDARESAARARLDEVWAALSAEGSILMPLQEYPFSRRYGWVQDRFGVSWQLMLSDPAGDPRPFLLPSLLYCGPAQGLAARAVDHYIEVFREAGTEAELGMRVRYPEPDGPATTDSVMFSDFRLGDQWFTAMDSGIAQPFSFTCGMSLEVNCADQTEIDHFWDRLSAVPEAEQCGWLADLAGLSWQIVPARMGEIMQAPGAFDRMMPMKKLVIAELEGASAD